jgi:membrane protein YqaA with SNARE-associated domain
MAVLLVVSSIWNWVHRIGAFAFIPIGLLDNSVVPIPGSMDALLIVLAASHKEFWWYYALMATLGSVIGGFVSYRIAVKGGKEMLEKKLGADRCKKAYKIFERWGFWSVFAGAIAPPPVPIVFFHGTAGAMQYPRKWFLIALATGRLVRFAILGWVASRYGQHIFSFFSKYYKPAFWTLLVLGIIGGIYALLWYKKLRRKRSKEENSPRKVAENPAA